MTIEIYKSGIYANGNKKTMQETLQQQEKQNLSIQGPFA